MTEGEIIKGKIEYDEKHGRYIMQCFEFIGGRWEGFVTFLGRGRA